MSDDYDPESNPIVRLHGEKIRDWKRNNAHVDQINTLRTALILVALGLILFGVVGIMNS